MPTDPRLVEFVRRYRERHGHLPSAALMAAISSRLGPQMGAGEDILRQAAKGVGQAGLSTMTGLGRILPFVPHEPFEDLREQMEQALGEPQTTAGRVAGVGGRIAGEAAQFLVPGAILGKVGRIASVASRFPRVAALAQPATRAARVGRELAVGLPVDVAIGAGLRPEESVASAVGMHGMAESPVGRSLAEAVVGGVAGGGLAAILGPGRAARRAATAEAAPEVAEEVPALGRQLELELPPGTTRTTGAGPMSPEMLARRGGPGVELSRQTGLPVLSDEEITAAYKGATSVTSETEIREGIEQVIAMLRRTPAQADVILKQEGERLIDKLSAAVGIGDIDIDHILKIMDDLQVGDGEAADIVSAMFREAARSSGRTLQRLSQLKKLLAQLAPEQMRRLPTSLQTPVGVFDHLRFYRRSAIDLWRASITSQLATAMRNMFVGVIRTPFSIFEETGTLAIRSLAKTGRISFKPAWEGTAAMAGMLRKGERQKLWRLLDEFGDQRDRLLQTPVWETAFHPGARRGSTQARFIRRWIDVIQIFNRTQEFAVRKLNFAARLGMRLSEEGLDLDLMARQGFGNLSRPVQKQLHKAIHESVTEALDVTFAMGSREFAPGGLARPLLNFYRKVPELALVHPFPRFFANSMRFLYDRTFAIFQHGVDPKFWKSLRRGDRAAAMQLVKATEGMAFLGAGLAFRASELAGPKWYQIKAGTDSEGNPRFIDTRPYAPLSTFMFLAEVIRTVYAAAAGEEYQSGIEPKDWIEAFAGIRRLTGSALFLVDAFSKSGDFDTFQKRTLRFAQAVIGGFATPAKTIQGVLSQWDDEEDIFRDPNVPVEVWGHRVPRAFSEFVTNLPALEASGIEAAPAMQPFREEPLGRQEPIMGVAPGMLRQATGLAIQTRTPLQLETERLNVQARSLTGLPTLDNYVNGEMGRMIEQSTVDEWVQSPEYAAMPDDQKKTLLGQFLEEIRAAAKEAVIAGHAREIVDEAVDNLKDLTPDKQRWRLIHLQLPDDVKQAILQRLQQMMPTSMTGDPIPALQGLQGSEAEFVAAGLPQRARSMQAG